MMIRGQGFGWESVDVCYYEPGLGLRLPRRFLFIELYLEVHVTYELLIADLLSLLTIYRVDFYRLP